MNIEEILRIIRESFNSEIMVYKLFDEDDILGTNEFFSSVEEKLRELSNKIGDIEIGSGQKVIYIANLDGKEILISDNSEASIRYAINKMHNYHLKPEGERYTDLYIEDLQLIGNNVSRYKDCVSWKMVNVEIKVIKL